MLADKTLQEFLSLGVKGYCLKHHLQCCDMCDDMHCCDNTNPLVRRLKKLQYVMLEMKTKSEELTELFNRGWKETQ